MPPFHPASLPINQLLDDCQLTMTRRGGPGGQHRNKVESAIVITHRPSSIMGQASERRSQHENRAVAIERLRINLALAIRCPVSADQQASELWLSRTSGGKLTVSTQHADFPALLAEALDMLAVTEFEVTAAASRLGVSNSQFIKFLKTCPPAFKLLNDHRTRLGLGLLK